jgi:hypothetical protein
MQGDEEREPDHEPCHVACRDTRHDKVRDQVHAPARVHVAGMSRARDHVAGTRHRCDVTRCVT